MGETETNQETRQDTKTVILDAAERLFAREGFHNTSLRAITGEAGVNLAAVNYHFGSKEALLDKVFERRLVPLNKIRKKELEAVKSKARAGNRRPGVEETLRAFIEPTFRFRDLEPGADDLMTLVGRALSEPDDTVRDIFVQHVLSIFYLLFETICEALPDVSKDLVFWRLQFALGAMSHIMCSVGKFQQLHFPEGINPDPDTDSMIQMLIPFITRGMETE